MGAGCSRSIVVDDAHPATLAEYRLAIALRVCQQIDRCNGGLAFTASDPEGSDCIHTVVDRDPLPEALIAEGRAHFDPVAAAACLATYRQLCVGGAALLCSRVVVGDGQPGDACSLDAECDSGACAAAAGACGACIALPDVGEPCTQGLLGPACKPGASCFTTSGGATGTGTCGEVLTWTQAPLGGGCSYANIGPHAHCAPDLTCAPNSQCVARKPRGTPCDVSVDECAHALRCLGDVDGIRRCLPIVEETTLGAACGKGGAPGAFHQCDLNAHLVCGTGDTCQAFAVADPSLCAVDADCPFGLCLDHACKPRGVGLGLPCLSNAECSSGYCEADACTQRLTCP